MNRRFTFGDDKIINLLTSRFVPCVANTHELQFGRTRDSGWFKQLVERMASLDDSKELRKQLGARKNENSIQGLYIFAADGTPYAWMNWNNPGAVFQFLNQGLRQFNEKPPTGVAESFESESWNKPKATTAIVRTFTRIRPTEPDWNVLNFGVGRDHIWILESEIEEIVSGGEGEVSADFDLPRNLVARLCRYHLVDNVRGEPDMWEKDEVRQAVFKAHRIRCEQNRMTFELNGKYDIGSSDGKRGIRGTMNGRLELDVPSRKVLKFRGFAEATAWGQSRFTPEPPPGRFGVVMAMTEVDDEVSKNVPPQGIAWDDYLKPDISAASLTKVDNEF